MSILLKKNKYEIGNTIAAVSVPFFLNLFEKVDKNLKSLWNNIILWQDLFPNRFERKFLKLIVC